MCAHSRTPLPNSHPQYSHTYRVRLLIHHPPTHTHMAMRTGTPAHTCVNQCIVKRVRARSEGGRVVRTDALFKAHLCVQIAVPFRTARRNYQVSHSQHSRAHAHLHILNCTHAHAHEKCQYEVCCASSEGGCVARTDALWKAYLCGAHTLFRITRQQYIT